MFVNAEFYISCTLYEGFAMISATDRIIIEIFQWVIRQVELFTPITRKSCIFAMLSLLSMIQLYLIIYHLGRFNILMFVFFVKPLTTQTVSLIIAYNQEEATGTLPRAIKERVKRRIVVTFFFLTLLCVVFIPVFSDLYSSNMIFTSSLTAKVLFHLAPLMLASMIEYLLCTSVLPPGEKARRKIEKELKRALPNSA